jgi:hypothetical protein
MSYLDTPRFHFRGQFFADPSTINNSITNFDTTVVYNNNRESATNVTSVSWNPNGAHFFKILPSPVGLTIGPDGTEFRTSAADPLVGATIQSLSNPLWARLVDLDPDQQGISQIYGLKIQLTGPRFTMVGNVRPLALTDLWGRVMGGLAGGIFTASGVFQSVVESIVWTGSSPSPVVTALRSHPLLSIKFVLDGFDGTADTDTFGNGRIVGTIGPASAIEPTRFVAARKLRAIGDTPMNDAPFQVTGKTLTIDLGNSIPTTQILTVPTANLGTMTAVIDPAGAKIAAGTIDYLAAGFFDRAGVVTLDLSDQAAALIAGKPLAISTAQVPKAPRSPAEKRSAEPPAHPPAPRRAAAMPLVALSEPDDGSYIDVAQALYRLEPGVAPPPSDPYETAAEAVVALYFLKFGVPVAGETIPLGFVDPGGVPNVNTPVVGLTIEPVTPSTGANGIQEYRLIAGNLTGANLPFNRRMVSSQVYFLGDTNWGPGLTGGNAISVLVFQPVAVPASPTWDDVRPVFQQYMRLYPKMRDLIDLADLTSLQQFGNLDKVAFTLGLPVVDPRYMPVTRDLSTSQKRIVLGWIPSARRDMT